MIRRLLPLLAVAYPLVGGAQPASAERGGRCDGRRISEVVIEREPPAVVGESVPGWARPLLQVALQHRTSQPSAIRPFLLLVEGGTCTEFQRAESERLLRVQPYLADASVIAAPDDSGGVRVIVSTVDEVPLIIGGRVSDGRISGVKYGSSNVNGAGVHAEAEWREGFTYRDGFGVRVVDHQAFDQPVRLALALERSPFNSQAALRVERPLLTSHQRFAWHAGTSDGSEYARFVRRDGPPLALAVDHSRLDIGGAFRVGGERRRIFVGPSISHQRVDPASQAVIATDSGFVGTADTVLVGRYDPVNRTRVAASVGLRLLSFARVTGFDALTGSQDIGRGIQLVALGGRSVMTGADGTVLGLDLYVGAGGQRRFVAVRARWEGEEAGAGGWLDAIGTGRLVWYERLSARRTFMATGDFAGAWGARLPYQLPLGRQAGIRGYADSRVVGARRLVGRAEHRWMFGQLGRHAAFGAAGFADVGAIWAGDVPFARNSGLRAGVGAGLLAAVPARSRRTLRLDVAVPVVRDRDASYDLRLTTSAPLREFWRDPPAINSIRSIAVPSGMLGLP